MGVHGLWRLIEPSGKPVPLESLENRVLAVDVSIWLHQAIKGFQDAKGAAVPNAHLLGIYHRVCKLLYYKIKPVFVFDGGVPVLKKQTIAKRNQLKAKHLTDASRIQKQLLDTLLKHSAVNKVLSEKTKSTLPVVKSGSSQKTDGDNLFKLPPELDSTISSSDEDEYASSSFTSDSSPTKHWDLHNIDEKSAEFKALPADVRHEILTDLKETRKQNSWGRIHELPTQSDEFSGYQMKRLLKRYSVQTSLEDAEKEMGGHTLSLGELESLLNDHGVITQDSLGKRIASDENTRYLYIKDVKKALETARLEAVKEETESKDTKIQEITKDAVIINSETLKGDDEELEHDQEFQEDMQMAIALSLEEQPSTSKVVAEPRDNTIPVTQSTAFSAAIGYMKEYSGLTPSGISEIFNGNLKSKKDETIKAPIAKIADDDDDQVILSEDSESESEFIDVSDNESKEEKMEIVIDKIEQLEDDLFSDVFDNEDKNKDKAVEIIEDKVILKSVEDSETQREIVTVISDEFKKDVESKDMKIVEAKDVEIGKTETPLVQKTQQAEEVTEKPSIEKMPQVVKLSSEDLQKMEKKLASEKNNLISERSSKERLAGNITDQMYQEAQELLQLFGIPYIIAPMEAEAQCAFLNEINLTDGTITDDSDIWLFGGKIVYKNFFNQSKRVMEFRSENIEHHFKLSRQQMILLALLVGSDYTVGISGIGPVTAMEILAAFPPMQFSYPQLISGLIDFKTWFNNGKVAGPARAGLRTKLKNVDSMDHFPNPTVIKAYLEPQVETSKDKFTWGKPDAISLIEYAKQKFGWTRKKSEEILSPVLKRLQENKSQSSIKDFFHTKHKVDAVVSDKMSKRIKKAVSRLGREKTDLDEDEDVQILKKTLKVSRRKQEKIETDIKKELEGAKPKKEPVKKKVEITQRAKDRADLLKNKMKAIEVFRKSKQGPGFVKKRAKVVRKPKDDAELSESSNSD